jgi:DMSO reductase iron-sulfur subunit
MHLPLVERAKEQSAAFTVTPRSLLISIGAPHCSTSVDHSAPRIPQRALEIGEQYRFHFDMTKCIGCKCCVVACNEQNGNPAHINWRRVGEIEGGWYPNTQRLHLSMGCNHCLEPTCLTGCPVDAYSKDQITGVVIHNAETCIGCQYCTWNCSYGVPQYNAERGVVGKCDMCHNRLAEGREPACVGACPAGAIQIEIVNIADWKRNYVATANAPGLPTADDSLSSTRITLPKNLPPDACKVDMNRVRPEHPHWPLVFMTVLTQLSVGAFAAIWLLQIFGQQARLNVAALVSLTLGGLALGASTMHLGRPMFAYRALKMWRRSWLSREVLLFGAFSQVAFVYAAMLWLGLPASRVVGALTVLAGAAGVTASACIYLVRPRPAWRSKHTLGEFYLSGAILGPLLGAAIGLGARQWLLVAAVAAAGLQLLNLAIKFLWLVSSEVFELKASARLLSTQLRSLLLLRSALLMVGGMILPLESRGIGSLTCALALAFSGEILGRYLFFVTVVPKNMAAAYLGSHKAGA